MRRALIVLLLTGLLVLAFSAVAMAAPGGQANPTGLKGADEVYLAATATFYDNPGKMFQAIRVQDGSNPHEWALTHTWGDPGPTVGRFIYQRASAAANR